MKIPTGLTSDDRKEVIQTLGINTSSKILSNPYPLGGYSGFEVGASFEIIDTSEISKLGDTNDSDSSFSMTRLSIGKGLYNDLDLYFQFVPYSGPEDVSEYGSTLRWSFFKADFLPINTSLVLHGNVINISDSFVCDTFGTEILVGVNVNDFSLYFGGGKITANSKFMSHTSTGSQGDDTVVDFNDPERNKSNHVKQSLTQQHTFVGLSFHFDKIFAALEIDRYSTPVYSAKLGVRF